MLINFQYAAFVQNYPQFVDDILYSAQMLQHCWDDATTIISNRIGGRGLTLAQRTRALNLMTAHLAVLNTQATSGQVTGLVQGATIDKVNVQLTPPPETNQWQWWLNQTQYGQQLLAMLQVAAVGGFFAGGFPTTFTLRR